MSEERRVVLERTYVVPLVKARRKSVYKRTPRAVRILREFVKRHMKAETVVILPRVNEVLWSRSIRNPPRRIVIKAVKYDDGAVEVDLP